MVVYMGSLSLFPVLVKDPGSVADWRSLVYVIIGLQFFFTVLALAGIWKKDVPENYIGISTSTEKPKAKDYITLFKNNKALQMLIVAASTNKISLGVSGGLLVFFYAYVVGVPELQSVVTPLTLVFIIAATIFALIITRRLGRKKAFTYTSLAAAIFSVVAIFLVPIAPASTLLLILVMGIYAFNNATTDMNVIPMIGDAADYENYQSGRFIPGMIGTAFSLIDKVVSSLSSVISGGLLSILGFISLTETEASPALFWGILIAYFAFPALGHFASVWAMKYYPLDNEMMATMAQELESRKQEA
jgi:Na+/melibiose symporter-like transporter